MKRKAYRTRPVPTNRWANLGFSQEKVVGFNLSAYQKSKVLVIGAGAIGGHAAYAMVRKGIGSLDIMDDDAVELKNLTRQFFYKKDVRSNKAIALAKNLSKEGYFKTAIQAFPYRFQEVQEMGLDFCCYDAIICAVDNNPTRTSVAKFCLAHKVPLIINGVSRDGSQMYCVVQQPTHACFGCIMPHEVNYSRYPCNLPGIIDIIQVVSGFTVYSLDTILMHRHREWNLRMLSLDGSMPESSLLVRINESCHLCREQNETPPSTLGR